MKLGKAIAVTAVIGTFLIAATGIDVEASAPPHCDVAAQQGYKGTCYAGSGDMYSNYVIYQQGRQPSEKAGASFK